MTLSMNTCMQADTSRVVWSFQANDPTDPLGNTAMFHDHMGVSSLNLLGGLTNAPADPNDVQSFDIGVTNVRKKIHIIYSHCK